MAIYPDKKDGRLTGRFRVELQSGKRRYRKRWDSLKEAKQDEEAVKAAWGRGEVLEASERAPGAPDTHTLASTMPLARGMLWRGQATEEKAWQHMDVISAILGGDTRLDDITTHTIDRLTTKLMEQGRAGSTVNRYLSHFSKFLKWCKFRQYRTLPLEDVKFERNEEIEGRIRWITAEEEQAIQDYLLGRNRPEATAVWKLIKIAIETGCRRDELLKAKAHQVTNGRLHLWAANTKTKTARTIPLAPETEKALLDLITSGTMPTERGLRSWWERVRTAMGLLDDPDFVFHACRHTCATRMVDAGVNILAIQTWLGHKVIQTTLRYAHVRPEILELALVKVGDFKAAQAKKAEIYAGFEAPPTYPTPGVYGHFKQAA